jgi:hypothetical protein
MGIGLADFSLASFVRSCHARSPSVAWSTFFSNYWRIFVCCCPLLLLRPATAEAPNCDATSTSTFQVNLEHVSAVLLLRSARARRPLCALLISLVVVSATLARLADPAADPSRVSQSPHAPPLECPASRFCSPACVTKTIFSNLLDFQ